MSFNAAQQKGFCLEEELPSTDYKDSKFGSNLKKTIKAVEELKTDYDKFSASTASPREIGFKLCNASRNRELLAYYFPNATAGDIVDILDKSTESSIVEQLANKTCKNRIKPESPMELEHFSGKTEELTTEINKQLSSQNMVAIAYDSGVLFDSKKK